jgi:hypothetical protein
VEAILLLVTEFMEELIWAQVSLICVFGALYLYSYVIKRRDNIGSEWVPAALVRDYLNRVRDGESAIRFQLFGESAPMAGGSPVIVSGSTDPALLREIEALRAQLSAGDQRIQEKDRIIADLKAKPAAAGGSTADLDAAKAAWAKEKAELEKKLAGALSAGSGSSIPADVQKQLDEMKARLQEYEVIEDDLANLKKYQIENKKLTEQLAAAGVKPSSEPVKAESAAPSHVATPIAAAAVAAPIAAAVVAPAAVAPIAAAVVAPAAAPVPTTPAAPTISLVDATASAAAPSADSAPAAAGEKKPGEEDLLSEFEKMLAS